MRLEKKNLLGIAVTAADYPDIENYILDALEKPGKTMEVMTLSFPMLGEYEKNPGFRRAIDGCEILLPDGIMVVWLSRLFKGGIKKRLSGPDFFVRFSKRAHQAGLGYFFLGSTADTLAEIEKKLEHRFPGIKRKGFYSPPFGPWDRAEEERMVEVVNKAGADVLWVGLTAPRQETWIHRHKDRLKVGMAAAIGAGFDFFAGTRKRAPLWMQRIGLEWFYRVLQEPVRMGKRYLFNLPRFVMSVARHLFKTKSKPR